MTNALRLDRDKGKLLGVCAGLANSLGIDAIWVRLGFITTVLLGFGFPILLYFIVALLAS
jgi:phage shock protein C